MSNNLLDDVAQNTSSVETNKAAAIRKAYQALGDVRPAEIVEYVKQTTGIEVQSTYVSVVKQQIMKSISQQPSYEALRLARKLVREVGSIQAARKTLDALCDEHDRVHGLRQYYGNQLSEIETMLSEKQMDPKDRRDLQKEKARINTLLTALEEEG